MKVLFVLLLLTLPLWAESDREKKARVVLDAVLEMSEQRAMQFGNYREALAMLRFHGKVKPGHETHFHRLEGLVLLEAGRYFEAEQACREWQAADPIAQTVLRSLALALSSRPDELKTELARLDGHKLGPLFRFLRGSLRFHLDWLAGEPGDVAARFRSNLAELKDYRSDRERTTGEPWLLEQGLKLWEGPMLTLIHTENQDATARQTLIDVYFDGQRRLQDLAQKNLGPKTLNPEFNFMVIENLLTTYEDFLAYLWFDRSVQQQQALERLLGDLDATLTRSSQTFLADEKKLSGMVEPLVTGVTFEGEAYPLGLAQFELRNGTVARQLARFQTIQLRSLWNLTEGKLERASAVRAQELLAKAISEQQRLGFHGGYLGLEDARWDQLELLLRQQEESWQSRVETLTGVLEHEARQHQYPPAQVAALTMRARAVLSLGQLERAEDLVDQAVALHEQGILGFQLSAAALVEKRRRNARLYRLQSEIKLRRGDPEGALAGVERERQARLELERGLPPDLSSQLARREALEAELRTPGADVQLLGSLKESDWAGVAARAVRPRLSSLTQLRALLPPSTSVAVYLPLERELCVVVVRPSEATSLRVPVSAKELEREVRQFRALVVDPLHGDQALRKPARQLHDWLVAPLHLAEGETLAVVAQGSLNYLPFAALVNEEGEYLGRSRVCVNLAGVGDIMQLSQPRPPAGERLLALANPDGTLPAAEDEVAAIAPLFPQPEVFVRGRATRSSLHWETPPSVMHVATHGNLDSGHPRASYLTLAGQGEAAKLRVADIYDLSLKGTELVVLSACETALGEWEPGSEITSLADAFQVAGSRSVMASLWPVEDRSTAELMAAVYRNRLERGLGKSLQLAQVQLMDKPATAHPFFWAPFILLGDFR
ncbi:MAG: CHAT domain-containing protein [Candidatus Eremiobacteraeota bacterium]|nr:CHAT domain-containing protein [Candidatus Eremiobacteraeota bacterium]MCW5872755.1 CHAT domain-containing protein [Candidatus Eremiobacteraeota bacterium]